MSTPRGMTLTEVLAVVGCMACLLSLMVPVVAHVEDAAHMAVCSANLSRLGAGLTNYAADHDERLPDCGAASPLAGPIPTDAWHFPSRTNAPGNCAWPHVRQVGNQANLWILVREGYADPAQFVCPATSDRPSLNSPQATAVMGFLAIDPATGRATPAEDRFLRRVAAGRCSYSYQNQFIHPGADPEITSPDDAVTSRNYHPCRLPILADRNPYTRTDLVRQPVVSPVGSPEANSLNHGGAGQNVLFLSGEVEWHDTPRCGLPRKSFVPDNIYWPDLGQPDDPLNIPRSPWDTFLVP